MTMEPMGDEREDCHGVEDSTPTPLGEPALGSLPESVVSLLDDDDSADEIPRLFFVVNNLTAEEPYLRGVLIPLEQAIIYAEKLTAVLAAQQVLPPGEPTLADATELLVMLLERKADNASDVGHLNKLITAAKSYLELVAPETPAPTLGTLGNASLMHYRLSKEPDVLLDAIEYLDACLNAGRGWRGYYTTCRRARSGVQR